MTLTERDKKDIQPDREEKNKQKHSKIMHRDRKKTG